MLPVSDSQIFAVQQDLRVAVVLDRSRSMEKQSTNVVETLARIQSIATDVDVYLTSSYYRGEQSSVGKLAEIAPEKIDYLGGQNAAELLEQFFALSDGKSYDAVFVLTDGSGFQLGGGLVDLPVPDAPIWMVHIDNNFPFGYDDGTLEAVQSSGGGIAGDIDEALTRLMVGLERSTIPDNSSRDVVDGYEWLTFHSDLSIPLETEIKTHEGDDPFVVLAARRLILNEMYRQRGQIEAVETLDSLHALAKEYGIVTPYSSMIVLVNSAQQSRLDKLEAQDNRFDREEEEIGETTPAPMEVTGVPEPHEWLLIISGAVILGLYTWRRRGNIQQVKINLP